MNLLAASGALCWAAGMAAWTRREAGVTETDELSDVGPLVVSAVQAGSAVEFRILKPGDGAAATTDEIGAVVLSN